MGRAARYEILPDGQPVRVACISECSRQQALLGKDRILGKDFSHRRKILLETCSRYRPAFALELYSTAVLPNAWVSYLHLHPEWAKSWSAEELLLRVKHAFPRSVAKRCREHRIRWRRNAPPPEVLCQDVEFIEYWRGQLASLPFFEQVVKQRVAIVFNQEDQVSGHFWSDRYGSVPVNAESHSILVALIQEIELVSTGVVPISEVCHSGSLWDRYVGLMREKGLEDDDSLLQVVTDLNELVITGLRTPDGRRIQVAGVRRESGIVVAGGLHVPDGAQNSSQQNPSRQNPSKRNPSRQNASRQGRQANEAASAGAVEPIQIDGYVEEIREVLALGPVDCRREGWPATDVDQWHGISGIGPVDPVEWVALSRWLAATWRIWRLMKPSADVEEEQIHRPGRHWKITDELLQVKPLDENLRDRVRRNLAHWLQVWGQACQLPGLSTEEEVQQWVERLLAVRENSDELAGVVAPLLGYGQAELERLRGVLARVRLRVADVIRTGEAWVRNPRRTAKELLGFNDWVRRRRAVLRRQREERAGSDENRLDSS
ncbi:MAG: hypothetical protein KatS3mg109_1469 [Pirellulaceae bacterium]|nr:MAG: hypothetical protein KatS3mg109_1469 [Pirellulaceae bacterium]